MVHLNLRAARDGASGLVPAPRQGCRSGLPAAVLAISALATACAPSSSYDGIPLARGAADPELQRLARDARAGDKQAQLELGIRYEEGRGLPVDLGRAKRLYGLAAAASSPRIYIYSPPIRPGGRGRIMSFRSGSSLPGLPEAARRLRALARGDRP